MSIDAQAIKVSKRDDFQESLECLNASLDALRDLISDFKGDERPKQESIHQAAPPMSVVLSEFPGGVRNIAGCISTCVEELRSMIL